MIINYLTKALCEKESVYVNNLGLFRKEYAPAQIKDGMITPPGYMLVYDPDFDGNGFAFTMYVSQKGGMLITEATTQIDQWVAQLKTALDNNKSVSFGNFGTFAKNDNGTISFVCDRIAELNVEYEGMEPVSLDSKRIKEEEEVETVDEVVSEIEEISVREADSTEKEEVSSIEEGSSSAEENGVTAEKETESVEESEAGENTEDSENTEESDNTEDSGDTEESEKAEESDEANDENGVDVVEEEEKDENDDENDDEKDDEDETDDQKRKKRPWLVVLIIVLIAALLAAAAYYFREQLTELYQQYFGPKATEQVNEEPIQDTPSTADIDTIATDSLEVETDSLSTMENSDNIEEEIVSEPTVINQLPDGENFFIDYEKGKFYVIVGSFRSEKEVREHIKSRKLEQYNPKVVLQQNSKNMRICIGIFDSEPAADSYGRSTGLNYWVLK